jgi:hypothetical protein
MPQPSVEVLQTQDLAYQVLLNDPILNLVTNIIMVNIIVIITATIPNRNSGTTFIGMLI